MITTLEIDSLVIPTEAMLEFDQDYTQLDASTLRRTAAGDANLRVLWEGKLATVITAKGWVPGGLAGLVRGATYTLKCAMVRAITSATTTVTLPAARRSDTDHAPIGFALLGDRLVETPITNLAAILAASTDDATLTAVAGASGYRVDYLPQLEVLITALPDKGASSAQFEWRLEAEQV